MAHGVFGIIFIGYMLIKYGFALIPGILVALFIGYSIISNVPSIKLK